MDVRKVSEITQVVSPEAVEYEFIVTESRKKADGTIVQVVDERATQRSRTTVAQLDAQIKELQAKKDAIVALGEEAVKE